MIVDLQCSLLDALSYHVQQGEDSRRVKRRENILTEKMKTRFIFSFNLLILITQGPDLNLFRV